MPKAGDRAASRRKKIRKNIPEGVVNIHSTFNNTIVTISDPQGNAVAWASAGSVGFKGSRKGTPFAAQMAAESAARKAADSGMRSVQVHVKGPGAGREICAPRLAICRLCRESDPGCHPYSSQWLSSAQASTSLSDESTSRQLIGSRRFLWHDIEARRVVYAVEKG